ncbi:hypothetical protein FACS189451_05600 [Bacteroidia bacterium]|nr:hypothetical protein FACS189446_1380 [Bacteroidia bacterium]GHT62089.1 hypothetical protein FACS189451_05600 [Bacteroidia bacterium]
MDHNYDLDKLNKDNIFSPNGIVVPFGSIDTIFLKKILDDKEIDSLYVDASGNYYLSYGGVYQLTLPEKTSFEIMPNDPVSVSIKLPSIPPGIVLPGITIPIVTGETVDYSLDIPEITDEWGTASLDSITLESFNILVSMELKDISLPNDLSIILTATLPEAITTSTNPVRLAFEAAAFVNQKQTLAIPVSKYDFTSRTNTITYSIVIQKTAPGGTITTSANPEMILSVSTSATDGSPIQTAYGKIDLHESYSDAFNTTFLKDAFYDSNLNFYNPFIQVKGLSNVGIPLKAMLHVNGISGDIIDTHTAISAEALLRASTLGGGFVNDFYYFAPHAENIPPGAVYRNLNIPPVIQSKPDSLRYELVFTTQKTDVPLFIDFTTDPLIHVGYQLNFPFSFNNDMYLTLSDTIQNIFTKDLIDAAFYDSPSSGDVFITADAEVNIPLDFEINVSFLKENNTAIPEIKVDPITLKVNQKDFVIHIKNQYFGWMKDARHLKIDFTVQSDGTPKSLSVNDYILLKQLIFKKTGGFHFELK